MNRMAEWNVDRISKRWLGSTPQDEVSLENSGTADWNDTSIGKSLV